MLSERMRNAAVGVTMLLALGTLMWGILLLGKTPTWSGLRPYQVTLLTPNANGASAGGKVDLNGVAVGQVSRVELGRNEKGQLEARVTLQIGGATEIPETTRATLGKEGFGTPYVSLYAEDANGPKLKRDGTAILKAVPEDSGLIPQDVRNSLTSVSKQLEVVAKDLHTLLAYNTPEAVAAADPKNPDRPVENVATLVVRLNRTTASLEQLLTDPGMHGQVRQVLQNMVDASAELKTTLATVETTLKNADRTAGKLGDTAVQASTTLEVTQKEILRVSEKLVDVLGDIEKASKQLTEVHGTAGKMINDPRLYEGMVDLSNSLRSTVDDLDFLLKKWKDEGVKLNIR